MGTILPKHADQAKTDEYQKMARDKSKKLFEEFEFRCERAAVMNYKKSSDYDQCSRYLEYGAFGLGSVFVVLTGVGKCLKKTGAVGVGISVLLEVLGKGDLPGWTLPTFSVRAEQHNNAGAAWQTLAHSTRAHLLLIDDPKLGPHDFSEWYQDLAKKREEVCKIVVIPAAVYKKSNGDHLFEILKRKKNSFEKYQEIKEGKAIESDAAIKEGKTTESDAAIKEGKTTESDAATIT